MSTSNSYYYSKTQSLGKTIVNDNQRNAEYVISVQN